MPLTSGKPRLSTTYETLVAMTQMSKKDFCQHAGLKEKSPAAVDALAALHRLGEALAILGREPFVAAYEEASAARVKMLLEGL